LLLCVRPMILHGGVATTLVQDHRSKKCTEGGVV
jgi:hypothetical protein